jgi:acetate kinase
MTSAVQHDPGATLLVLNSGSSSLKFGLFSAVGDDDTALLEGSATGIGRAAGELQMRSRDGAVQVRMKHLAESQPEALQKLADALAQHWPSPPVAVGHRVVHGGAHLRTHKRVDAAVLQQLREAVHFAPLHIPAALSLIEQAQRIFADAQHFACLDNAFHADMPAVASHLALPRRYFAEGVLHYGFHGLSYESLVQHLGAQLPARAVFAHLGSGSSVCALRHGKSIDTSMGLTPTGGLPMGTRSGDLDPGVLLYLMRHERLDADALERLLNHDSGLAGVAGGESDMQVLLQRSTAGDADAALAVEMFATAVRKYVGAYAALLGGLDLLVFTGGVGEHSAELRERICAGLEFMGLGGSADDAKVKVIPAAEELQIARHCRQLLQGAA